MIFENLCLYVKSFQKQVAHGRLEECYKTKDADCNIILKAFLRSEGNLQNTLVDLMDKIKFTLLFG